MLTCAIMPAIAIQSSTSEPDFMKIGVYKDTLANRRGADVAVLALAEGLAERGHEAVVFEKPKLAQLLSEKWDIIISTGTNELLDLREYSKAPIVQQFHTHPSYPFRHWLKHWRRNRAIMEGLGDISAIQVLCAHHAKWLASRIPPRSAAKISVIGNWSAFECTAAATDTYEKPTIVYAGALNKDKNPELLLKAFARIAPSFPDWKLEIYGRGKTTYEKRLSKLALKAGKGRVLFQGFQDLRNVWNSCAFLAFPSRTEGFPLVVIDAAMFSKPTLSIFDWIGCGQVGGGLVSKASVADYANALESLMSNTRRRQEMGATANAYCHENYARKNILNQWEELLEECVRKFHQHPTSC